MGHHGQLFPIISNSQEFLIHGVKFSFTVPAKELTVGIPTAYAAKPIKDEIVAGEEPLLVCPSPKEKCEGLRFNH